MKRTFLNGRFKILPDKKMKLIFLSLKNWKEKMKKTLRKKMILKTVVFLAKPEMIFMNSTKRAGALKIFVLDMVLSLKELRLLFGCAKSITFRFCPRLILLLFTWLKN